MLEENSDLSLLVRSVVIRRRLCLQDRLNRLFLGKRMWRAEKLSFLSMSEAGKEPQTLAAFFSKKPV